MDPEQTQPADPTGPGQPPGGASLDVEGVSVTFPDASRPALDDVDLRVAAGEVVSLLGPSGCGKTTLLRVVAGLTTVDRGAVRLDGADLTGVPSHRRGVGLMFQDYALFPHRDVGGNVEFGLRMAGMGQKARVDRVAEVLELVGLPGWERRAVGPLSGGERQRVALARALAPSPRLLLLDEPLGALDRSLRDRLVPELGTLFRTLGLSVVHVTHDQTEALAIADRVVVMDHGVVVQDGPPVQVWARPASSLVARILGLPNIVDGPAGTELVRPDAVRVRPAAAGGNATVAALGVEGTGWSVTVVLDEGGRLQAHLPATELTPGDRVDVTVDPAGRRRL